ncbi:hypothetical protein N6H14_03095 [Paenibacillus sp. CC-CFT747]|nr:hypothetical protein N6H14_03095 [Paenibacillus sp. CC-CFT747]
MTERLECLGIPVRADETRSGAVCRNGSGEERVVLAARGYVLIVNPETGECRQVPFPEGLCDYPFASHSTESGLFLTGAGPLLMILDPWQGEFLAWFRPEPEEEIVGFAFAEGPDGTVYATTYPGCRLIGWNPKTGTCLRVGRLDDRSRYAMTLAAGADGWLYAGLGTETAGLAAYRPADGARSTFRGGTPCRGSGQVHLGADGAVYGSLPAGEAEMEAASEPKRWFRLAEGKAVPVSEAEVSPSAYGGTGYNKLHRPRTGGRRILDWQLADNRLVIEGEGEARTVPLVYEGNGTALSLLPWARTAACTAPPIIRCISFGIDPRRAFWNPSAAGCWRRGRGQHLRLCRPRSCPPRGRLCGREAV